MCLEKLFLLYSLLSNEQCLSDKILIQITVYNNGLFIGLLQITVYTVTHNALS